MTELNNNFLRRCKIEQLLKVDFYILYEANGSSDVDNVSDLSLSEAIEWFKYLYWPDEGMTIRDSRGNIVYTYHDIKLTYNGSTNNEFYIEVCYNANSVASAFINGIRMNDVPNAITGSNDCKIGVILSNALNVLTGQKICDNIGQGEYYTIKMAAKHGITIEVVTFTKNGTLFKFINF